MKSGPRVLVITGAGISAESGIPTFRGQGGYWRRRDPRTLATPEAFARDPLLVWDWYRERRIGVRASQPNAAHVALVHLAMYARDFLLITQNVDDLHRRAQWETRHLEDETLIQVHGDLFLTRCSRCAFSRRDAREDEAGVPECPSCGALLRPGVVWFGEALDPDTVGRAESYVASGACDQVLVIGTTAAFDYIVDWAVMAARRQGQIIEVNPDDTRLSPVATTTVREPAATAVPRIVAELVRA
jgi:NAD-dependent deacetylase